MKAVVLVGGQGTRLRPLTLTTPKAMVPVLNRPFMEHMFRYLLAAGISRVILATSYLPTAIEDYFGDGRRYRLRITYLVEDTPLGTGGAVKNAAPHLDDTFVVLNGDVFTELDLKSMLTFHREKNAVATMALASVEDPSSFGVVVTDPDGRITRFVEKPSPENAPSHYINAGVYVLEPQVLEALPPTGTPSMLEQELFPLLARHRQAFYGYPFNDFWLDVGTPQNYLRLHQHLLLSGKGGQIASAHIHRQALISGPVELGAGTVVEAGARVIGPTALGPECHIEEGAVVDSSVLWERVRVRRGAVVRDCIMASNCVVAEGCQAQGQVLGQGEVAAAAKTKTGARRRQ